MITSEHLSAAKILWDYHRMMSPISEADGIMVFGSNDLRVAEHAVTMFEAGLGKWILFSGARGRMTQDWPDTEAATMANVARSLGVQNEHIFIEDRATNTGENIRFSRELLSAAEVTPTRVIVLQKPYMERRTQAALDVQWPEVECLVTSPPCEFENYCIGELTQRLLIEAMVGDFQRIIDYPALGFASEQDVSEQVLTAFHYLRDEGYTGQVLRS